MSARTPADLARETLRLLAQRHQPPTPEHYQAAYEEVAGLVPQEAFPVRALRNVAGVLPSQTPHQARLARDFGAAIEARNWAALQTAILGYAQGIAPVSCALPAATTMPSTVDVLPDTLAEQLARLIENTVGALGDEDEQLREMSLQLVTFLRSNPPPLVALEQMLQNYSYRLSFNAKEQGERRQLIFQHLGMTLQHIRSLASEDSPLQHQAQALEEAMQPAWTLEQLQTIGNQLKSLLFRHFELESGQQEAFVQLREKLGHYAQQLADMSEHHSPQQARLKASGSAIAQSPDLRSLVQALPSMLDFGQSLATEQRHLHAQLQDLHEQTDIQENTIQDLEKDLQRLQETSRHDPATGTLNGKGLQETMQMEMARAHRHHSPLCAAVLQLDSPPELLQTLGSKAHDILLRHFVHVLRNSLRPQDSLARTPDNRLVLLLPYNTSEQAEFVLTRLQAEIAQRPLVHGDNLERMSFSAGVVALKPHELPLDFLKRAAQAAEQAKNLGAASIIAA